MLDLVYENQTGDGEWAEPFFDTILSTAIQHLKLKDKKVEIGLHLVTPERSRELNNQYRQKDKPTDVLSFPLEERSLESYGILPLGDIFICLDVARAQAEELGIPLKEELARLTVHGFLHLLGHDHERSPEDEKKMTTLQEEIIKDILD